MARSLEAVRNIAICSDSQAALKALEAAKVTSKLVAECIGELQRLATNKRLQLRWVPAHSGVQGNEEADRLAREASQLPYIGPEPALGISPRAVRTSLRSWERQQLLLTWNNAPDCRQAKQLIPGIRVNLTQQLLALSRRQLRLVVGMLTGHNCLNRHLHIMGVVDDPTCPMCLEEVETSVHFLGECEALVGVRQRILGLIYPYLGTRDIQELGIANLLRLIRDTGRF